MADLGNDGNYLVTFCETIADLSAPSIATELSTGLAVEGRITPTGLERPWTTAHVDNSKLNSTFGTERTGRRSVALKLTYVREDSDQTGVEAAFTYGKTGFLVIRDNKPASTAYASGDKVEVYPVQCEQPSKSNPAPNEDQTATVGFAMTDDPVLDAVVAA